jgi:hypothetical protein
VTITNAGNVVYNAPMVAFNVDASQINFPDGHVAYSKVHDQVVAIDPSNMTVTLNLINSFSFGRPVWYLSSQVSPIAMMAEPSRSSRASGLNCKNESSGLRSTPAQHLLRQRAK